MSNHPKRRVVTAERLFPQHTPFSEHDPAARLTRQLMRATHVCVLIEHLAHVYEVNCDCGFVAAAPFGEQQAERIRESHYARFHVIPDPLGSVYGA